MTLPPSLATSAPDPDEEALALLLKALDALTAEERTQVLMFLLKRGLGAAPAAEPVLFTSVGSSVQLPVQPGLTPPGARPDHPKPGARRLGAMLDSGISVSRPAGEGQQMVPVRFSTEAHQRLRTWSGENGFPMAAVVRGLVDQFLDGQQAASEGPTRS